MPAEMFDVGVSVYIIDRISRDLAAISRSFGTGEGAVRRMQQSIDRLTASHALLGARFRTNQQLETRNLELMEQRLALMRTRAAKLKDIDAIKAAQLRVDSMEQSIASRTARMQIRDAETQNRLLQQRVAIQERNVALAESQARATRDARIAAGQRGVMAGALVAGIGAGGLYALGRMATSAGDIQMQERLLETIRGFTPTQARAITNQSLMLHQHLGVFTVGSLNQLLLTLMSAGVSRGTAVAIRPEVANIADVLYRTARADPNQTATVLGEIANLFNARTPKQFTPIAEAAMRAAMVTPGGLSTLENQLAFLAPLRRTGMGAQDLIRLAALTQQIGGAMGGLSPENISTFLARFRVAGNPLAESGRAMGLSYLLGIPQFRHAHPNANILQILEFLAHREQQLGPKRFTALSAGTFGAAHGLRTFLALAQPGVAQNLIRVAKAMDRVGTSAKVNAETLDTLDGQSILLRTNLDALGQSLGMPLVQPLQRVNHWLATVAGSASVAAWSKQNAAEIARQMESIGTVFAVLAGAGTIRAIIGLGTLATGLSAGPFLVGVTALTALVELITHWHQVVPALKKPFASAGNLSMSYLLGGVPWLAFKGIERLIEGPPKGGFAWNQVRPQLAPVDMPSIHVMTDMGRLAPILSRSIAPVALPAIHVETDATRIAQMVDNFRPRPSASPISAPVPMAQDAGTLQGLQRLIDGTRSQSGFRWSPIRPQIAPVAAPTIHVEQVHIHAGGRDGRELAQQFVDGLRTAVARTSSGAGIYESPMLGHGPQQP